MTNVEDHKKEVGFAGLHLGVDASKSRHMRIADGARFEEAGILTTRLGRTVVALDFPSEGIDGAVDADYVETIDPFVPGKTRGITAMYDQRISVQTPESLADVHFRNVDLEDAWELTVGVFLSFVRPRTSDIGYVLFQDPGGPPGVGPEVIFQSLTKVENDIKESIEYELKMYLNFRGGFPNKVTMILPTGFPSEGDFTLFDPSNPLTTGMHSWRFQTSSFVQGFKVQIDTTDSSIFEIHSLSLRQVRGEGNLDLVPQRLNFVYKENGELHFNDDSDPQAIWDPAGASILESERTEAKIVTLGSDVIVADESSTPRMLRRRPADEQAYLQRIRYEWRELGVRWPTSDTPSLRVAGSMLTGDLELGTYRFRLCLKDKWGNLSNCTLPAAEVVSTKWSYIILDWGHLRDSWRSVMPEDPVRVNLYFSYQAETTFSNEEATDYRLFGSVAEDFQSDPADTAGSFRFNNELRTRAPNSERWEIDNGHPPRLKDVIVVNTIAYGIAMPDVIYREGAASQGERNPASSTFATIDSTPNLPENDTRIIEKNVDSSYFFVGKPFLPGSMQNWYRIGRGSEQCVGLAEIGSDVLIFTSQSIYVYDVGAKAIRRVFSKVGCAARDSIAETERGVRFMGTDGVPRLFNGATVEEVSEEVLPVFRKDDFRGHYQAYDGRYPNSVTSAYGNGTYFLNYPSTVEAGLRPLPGIPSSDPESFSLAMAREGEGRAKWSIDTQYNYRQLLWLGRESRMFAVDSDGNAYYVEEGVTDTSAITYTFGFRWDAAAGGLEGQFYRFRLEYDSRGFDMTVVLTVDEDPALSDSFVTSTNGRNVIDTNLPPHFKGRFMDVRITGSYTSTDRRPEIYDHFVESGQRGEF